MIAARLVLKVCQNKSQGFINIIFFQYTLYICSVHNSISRHFEKESKVEHVQMLK